MSEIIIAGTGAGSENFLTPEVMDALKNAECVIAHKSRVNLIPENANFIELADFRNMRNLEKLFREILAVHERILLLVSGDPGIFSLMPFVKRKFPDVNLRVLPGISSLQVLCAKFCETWHDAKIISGHGREVSGVKLLNEIERNRLVIFFCDGVNSPEKICRELLAMENLEIIIGENLSLESERIFSGAASDFSGKIFASNSLMMIRNLDPYTFPRTRLRDEDFVRDSRVKITNRNLRSIILDDLGICDDSILWDIGAGTGSISISVALENPDCEIHAVDCKVESARIIRENIRKFHVHNIAIHNSRASEILRDLPIPTHVFIGGNGGELCEILGFVKNLGANIRVLVECVTLESFVTGAAIMKRWENFTAKQVLISEGESLMRARSPVMLLSAKTCAIIEKISEGE
mgnify:CR=1 FL=1